MALTAAEKQRKYRARLNADPVRRQKHLQTQRERWRKCVEEGKKKPIQDLSEGERRQKRTMWRAAQKRSREKREATKNLSCPPQSPRLGDHPGQPPQPGSWSTEATTIVTLFVKSEEVEEAIEKMAKVPGTVGSYRIFALAPETIVGDNVHTATVSVTVKDEEPEHSIDCIPTETSPAQPPPAHSPLSQALERTGEDVVYVKVFLEMDTQPLKKNKGVMTRPRVKDSGTDCDSGPKASGLYVDRDCLLQLFLVCDMCSFGTGARIQEETGRFCVIQDCKNCGYQKKWWSQSAAAETEDKETTEEGKQMKKAGCDGNKQNLEDVCSLTMELTSELFEDMVAGDQMPLDEEDQLPLDEEDQMPLDEKDQMPSEEEDQMPSDEEDPLPSDDDKGLEESSDEWCPSDEEKELLMESGCSENENSECDDSSDKTDESWLEGKLVEWCVDCNRKPQRTCTRHRHKKLYACRMCVQEKNVGFDRFYMRFDDVAGFREHVKGEHDFRPRSTLCTECGVLSYKNHLCEHKTKKYTCLDCGKRCISKHGLLVHSGIHRLDRTYPCKFCLRSFKTKSHKHNHEKTHAADERSYRCSECPETFSNIHKRNGHLRTHGNLKRHICTICLSEYRDVSHLQRHVLVHTGEKPFVCEVCQRSFNQQSHLNSHMRLHTGERPFVCSQCGKGFNHNVSLKNHLQRYHQN